MKIGIDCRLWNETGVGRYIRALVSQLQKIDHKNDYVLFLPKLEFNNITLSNQKWSKILADVSWHSWEEQFKMPNIYKFSKADLIHIPYFSVPIFIKQPYIVTIHDLTISHYATGKATTKPMPIYLIKRLAYNLILKQAVSKSNKILTVSNYVKNQLIREFNLNSRKVVVTYESGELEDKLIPEKASNLPTNYCLYVGNAHPHKNLEKLLYAFAKVRKELPGFKLFLIGKDDYFYTRLKKYAEKLQLTDGVFFINSISNSELPNWYNKATLLVFPSLSEGFGIPGLEAMNCNCPVVASNIPVFKEIYGDAAVYFNPNSIDDMALKIIQLLKNKQLLLDLIEKGKIQAKKYSWEKTATETLKVYENSLSI